MKTESKNTYLEIARIDFMKTLNMLGTFSKNATLSSKIKNKIKFRGDLGLQSWQSWQSWQSRHKGKIH